MVVTILTHPANTSLLFMDVVSCTEFSVTNGGDDTWRSGRVWAARCHPAPPGNPPHAQAGWHLYYWQLELSHPGFHPSSESLDCLRICDEQAAKEKVHLDPEQERPLLELWEGLLQDQQDGDDGDYAEGEDEVEVGEGDEVGDGPPGPPA